ncbi:MFS transporter [Novosphingobium mangrovi (ex Huang et al. 2023)]|uniref:MFS transporter n=1 Tax=Novosphingobium mangrovi (ex Huang et al. 2023) TaxID=2976432 RepID=A0ABT2I3V5_9SPHN|nr:MFS transporter [Novosphingobium mangrovi (ex Huang et al. 2023)]MCT2399486.1 MFS transporter [Novosphingobium mangrovi (ex Huang et al. 2023)]
MARSRATPPVPRTVWALGFVSLFMDVSSEIIHALLPLFLTVTLGASVMMVGLVDGIAEATAAIAKVVSGYVSDRMGRRKPLILLGYGLAALSKPLFPMAGSAATVLLARFIDRSGKGMRGAPRDALIADVTPREARGRAYGLRQALDSTGAFLGPAMAIGLMIAFHDDIRRVFWIAALPAVIAFLIIVFAVSDKPGKAVDTASCPPIALADLKRLPARFWKVVALGGIFTLARFSEAFLILKATQAGLPIMAAPLVLVAMNLVYSLGAYPAGALADDHSARWLLQAGLVLLVVADAVLAFTTGVPMAFVGIALWGGHMAMTQGLLSKLVADHAPEEAAGSAFGLFNLTLGIATLIASALAGILWESIGPRATFIAGGAFAASAIVLAQVILPRRPEPA